MSIYETVDCLMCGSDSFNKLYNFGEITIVKCNNCDLVYSRIRYNQEYLFKNYNEEKASSYEYYMKNNIADKKTFINRLKIVNKYKDRGKLLDVGCNYEAFIEQEQKNV